MAPGHMTGLLLVLCRETVLILWSESLKPSFSGNIYKTSFKRHKYYLKNKTKGEISSWKTIWKAATAGNAYNSRKTVKIRDASHTRTTAIQRQQEPQQQQEGQQNVISPQYQRCLQCMGASSIDGASSSWSQQEQELNQQQKHQHQHRHQL